MAAPARNEFWRLVKAPTGRPPSYTPQQLWEKALEYFEWYEENPLYECKVFNYQGEIVTANIPKMRAMTESSFCLFAGIDRKTFINYKGAEGYQEFFHIAANISQIIYNQKFEGAAAEFLNANIIARELGLADKSEHTGKDGEPLPPAIINVFTNPKPTEDQKTTEEEIKN